MEDEHMLQYTIAEHEVRIARWSQRMERHLNEAIHDEAVAQVESDTKRAEWYRNMSLYRLDWAIEAENYMRTHICARNMMLYKKGQA